MEKIDYTQLFHVGIREEGQLAFIFTITGDTVSHFTIIYKTVMPKAEDKTFVITLNKRENE